MMEKQRSLQQAVHRSWPTSSNTWCPSSNPKQCLYSSLEPRQRHAVIGELCWVEICLIPVLKGGVTPTPGKELIIAPALWRVSSGPICAEGLVTTPKSYVTQQCLNQEAGRQRRSPPEQSQDQHRGFLCHEQAAGLISSES